MLRKGLVLHGSCHESVDEREGEVLDGFLCTVLLLPLEVRRRGC